MSARRSRYGRRIRPPSGPPRRGAPLWWGAHGCRRFLAHVEAHEREPTNLAGVAVTMRNERLVTDIRFTITFNTVYKQARGDGFAAVVKERRGIAFPTTKRDDTDG